MGVRMDSVTAGTVVQIRGTVRGLPPSAGGQGAPVTPATITVSVLAEGGGTITPVVVSGPGVGEFSADVATSLGAGRLAGKWVATVTTSNPTVVERVEFVVLP